MNRDATFTELVQLHERKWGDTAYPGRPSLANLLQGHIVAMWVAKGRFIFSVHSEANGLNELVESLVLPINSQMDSWRLAKIFVDQQPIKFKVRIVTERQAEERPSQAKPDSDGIPLNRQSEAARLPRQPKLEPLPKHPNKHHGEMLPGRHVTMLPGRNIEVVHARSVTKRRRST